MNIFIDHGNNKIISKSKTRNNIAIIKNLIEKGIPIFDIIIKPHS